jgi:TPR repeat protein
MDKSETLDMTSRPPGDRLQSALRCIALMTIACGGAQIAFLPVTQAAEQSFVDGLAAYDGGDVDETVRIWTTLAETGNADAQAGLAGLYLAGSGVPRDPAKAAALYQLAAEQGNSDGQLNLGRLHLDGIGVARNPAAAYAWLALAAEQGRRWADEKRSDIVHTLSAG